MGRINLNLDAQRALRNLSQTNARLSQSVERISSGLRINRAADDAAGLSISERLRTEVRGLNQATRNGQDALSLIQTAEGALTEVHSILQRMRELGLQGINDTLNSVDREAIKSEVAALKNEIDRIAAATKFNQISLLRSATNIALDSPTLLFKIGHTTDATNEFLQLDPINATSVLIGSAGVAGAATLSIATGYLSAHSTVSDHARGTFTTLVSSVDKALDEISAYRAGFGAKANRLEYTLRSLQTSAENAAASESRIRDADVAAEVSTFVREQILQQAAVAVLSQANQAPSLILQLLR